MTLTLGAAALQAVTPQLVLVPYKSWACVRPMASPALAEANSPARPCAVVLAGPRGLWQPLQLTTSPGRSCSQAVCCGKLGMRGALASSTEIWKATLAGTLTRTEPSASIGT